MQFSCESCKAHLQIADEKVRGKRLIVRCKRCGAKIALADPAVSKSPPRVIAPPPASSAPAASMRDTDTESTRAMDSDVLEKALQASRRDDAPPQNGSPPTQRFAAPPPPAPPAPAVWYAMLHGRQTGPLTLADLEVRANEGELGPRTYVWCEGMESWQRARDVLELVELFPQLPAAPTPLAVPATHPTPSRAQPAVASEAQGRSAATQPGAPVVAEAPRAEPRSLQAETAAAEAAEPLPRNEASSKPRPVPQMMPRTVMFESAAPAQGKGPFVVFLGLMALAIAAAVLWIVLGAAPQKMDEPRPEAQGGAQAGNRVRTAEAVAWIGLTADQVRRKLDENKPALQDCVDDALQRDPGLRVGKIHVATTIAPSGEVTDARIDQKTVDESPLGACLKRATRRIVFPRFSGAAFDVDIPISVSGGR